MRTDQFQAGSEGVWGTMGVRHLNVAGIARHLGVSEGTIRRLVKEDGIPYFRVRGSLRFDPEEVVIDLKRITRGR